MTTRAQIVAEALTWVGTPVIHQANVKGAGCDCAGLLRGVLISLGMMPDDLNQWPNAHQFAGYSRTPDGSSMRVACETYMREIDYADADVGDVLLVSFKGNLPQHVGILTSIGPDRRYWVHADNHPRNSKVTHSRLILNASGHFPMRLVAAYTMIGVE